MDTYLTITAPASGRYTVKMSRFLSFAYPVTSEQEARDIIKRCQKDYHDARHVCWAYMLGYERNHYQSNDNGEPSGTAGKPILGQINSLGLTNVLVCVVRYFGGIKLGTGGLIDAYRTAARMALEEAPKEQQHASQDITITCSYINLNIVMSALKSLSPTILSQQFDNVCSIVIRIRLDHIDKLEAMLKSDATITKL